MVQFRLSGAITIPFVSPRLSFEQLEVIGEGQSIGHLISITARKPAGQFVEVTIGIPADSALPTLQIQASEPPPHR